MRLFKEVGDMYKEAVLEAKKWFQENKMGPSSVENTDEETCDPNPSGTEHLPMLYNVYKEMGIVTSFQNILDNIFLPLFEVSVDPDSHPQLHVFLKQVVGLYLVDDEANLKYGLQDICLHLLSGPIYLILHFRIMYTTAMLTSIP